MTNNFDTAAKNWDQDPRKVERAKITAEKCKNSALASREKLLDFGGGTGLLSFFLHDYFEKITIADTSKGMLQVAEEKIKDTGITNIDTLRIDQGISEISEKFSAIITLMTLHHILELDQFFRHAAKILHPKGSLMIADLYTESGQFHHHDPDFHGHNGFEVSDLENQLEAAGFTLKKAEKYYEIKKEITPGREETFPLFFGVAEKK